MGTSSRGSFIAGAGAAAVAFALPIRSRAGEPYTLWLVRQDTGEEAAEPFSLDGKTIYTPGYYRLCAMLRDNHVDPKIGDVQMSIHLVETLWAILGQESLAHFAATHRDRLETGELAALPLLEEQAEVQWHGILPPPGDHRG